MLTTCDFKVRSSRWRLWYFPLVLPRVVLLWETTFWDHTFLVFTLKDSNSKETYGCSSVVGKVFSLKSINSSNISFQQTHNYLRYSGPELSVPTRLENLENQEKREYTWKTWKYHGILKNLINIMEKWHETWTNLVATKKFTLDSLKQYKIHWITGIERKVH